MTGDVLQDAPSSAPVARVAVVREEPVPGPVPLYRHPAWGAAFPWLIQGTTGRGPGEPHDLRLAGATSVGDVLGRWRTLRETLGCARAVYARQVHGPGVVEHGAGPAGFFIADGFDGHVTRAPGLLLTVSVADCVPIFLVDPERRAVALLHGGWRGVAAGILEAGAAALAEAAGSPPEALLLHLGPAICGACYEVGPEVHAALGLPAPPGPAPVDLRAVLAERAAALGLDPRHMTRSAYCTLCGDSPFFSHRAGNTGRQVGVLAVAPP